MSDIDERPADREAQLLAQLRSLPGAREPERDLWPDLAMRIAREEALAAGTPPTVEDRRPLELSRRRRTSRAGATQPGRLSLAAALMLALGLGFWLGQQHAQDREAQVAARSWEVPADAAASQATQPSGRRPAALLPAGLQGPQGRNAMSDAEAALMALKMELRASLALHREALPALTIQSIDDNLRTIDRAILELHRAIEANPQSTELRRALMTYHENEIALLERVTRAASRL